jgi:hypothetical protein
MNVNIRNYQRRPGKYRFTFIKILDDTNIDILIHLCIYVVKTTGLMVFLSVYFYKQLENLTIIYISTSM